MVEGLLKSYPLAGKGDWARELCGTDLRSISFQGWLCESKGVRLRSCQHKEFY